MPITHRIEDTAAAPTAKPGGELPRFGVKKYKSNELDQWKADVKAVGGNFKKVSSSKGHGDSYQAFLGAGGLIGAFLTGGPKTPEGTDTGRLDLGKAWKLQKE